MPPSRFAALVSLFCISAAGLAAQDVAVSAPAWFRSDPAPDTLPQPKSRLRPDYPSEMRGSDEIGYALVIEHVDEKGGKLGQEFGPGSSTRVSFLRAVEAEFDDRNWKPAMRNGQPVDGVVWFSVIFNPKSASTKSPDATPRLLAVTPVVVAGRLLSQYSERPIVDVTVNLDAAGTVTGVTLASDADRPFEKAIHRALDNWRFAPARQNGQPVAATLPLRVVLSTRVSPIVTLPRVLKQVQPIYPPSLIESGLRGEVVIDFAVDVDGSVQNPVIKTSTNPAFDQPALEALEHSRFQPGLRDGRPAKMNLEQPVTFEVFGVPSAEAYSLRGDSSKLPPEYRYDTPPKFHGTVIPVYPYALLRDGVSGSATVAFYIDSTGHVQRPQVIKASQPEFGLALAAAVDAFEFDPALKNGRPTTTILSQSQEFSIWTDNLENRLMNIGPDRDLASLEKKHPERIVSANRLDAPLRPISRRKPVFPTSVEASVNQGKATIEFLIAEDGRASLPRIVQASDPAFGYAAMQAVSVWRFDPPKLGGKAVVTRAQIPFTFQRRVAPNGS